MDLNQIYVKTTSGEEAMHRRTRVMQRNLRMVLILVDGKSTVSDLSLKIGNPQLTENALAELEQGGFIAPREEPDSLWSESKKVAQEIRDAALNKAIQVVAPSRAPEPSVPPPPSQPPVPPPRLPEPAPLSIQSAFSDTAFPFPPMPFSKDDRPALSPAASARTGAGEKASARLKERFSGIVRRLSAVFTGGKPLASDDDVSIKPIRRGTRSTTLHWSGFLTLAFLALVILGTLLVFFFPYDIYRPNIEAALMQATGHPVKIGSVKGELYPKPGMSLIDVQIGSQKEGVSVAEIRVLPELGSLFGSRVNLRSVALRGANLPVELIGAMPTLFSSLNAPTSKIGVKAIRFEKSELSFAGLTLSDLEGDVVLGSDGAFQAVRLHTPANALDVEARPGAEGLAIKVNGLAWRPSEKSRLMIDGLELKGVLAKGIFTIRDMEIRAFDGLTKGIAVIRGVGMPSIAGEVNFERINAARFGEAIGIGSIVSGDTSGKASFSAAAEEWPSLFRALEVDGTFAVVRGSLRGIDLPEAVRRVSQAPVQGGATQFEQMKASLRTTKSGYQLSGISLDSGLMQSTGAAEIGRDLSLKGRMDLQMRGTANQMRVPVMLGGTLVSPEIQAGAR